MIIAYIGRRNTNMYCVLLKYIYKIIQFIQNQTVHKYINRYLKLKKINMNIKNILIINYWRNKGAITVLILKSTFAGNNCNTQSQRGIPKHMR